MKTRNLLFAFWLAADLATAGATNGAATPPGASEITPVFINQLAEEMRTNQPALRAAEARSAAAAANADAVKIWEDPTLRLGGMAADRALSADEGNLIYGAEQKLPLFGKTQSERRVAQAEHVVAQARAGAQFQSRRRDLAIALFQTALANRTLEINRQDLDWIETLLAATERRYEVGSATQVEVLRLQNERAQRLNQITNDEQRLSHAQMNLNRLLGRGLEAAWPALRLPPLARPVTYNTRLADLATRYQPELAVLRREVDQAHATVDAARRQRNPDLSLGAEARNYTGNGDFRQAIVMLQLSLPLGNRKHYDAAVQRENAKLSASEFDAASFEVDLRSEIHELTVKIDTARREALLYRDEIIPRSETALQSAQASWENGRGTLRDVIDARRMLLDGERLFSRAVADQYEFMSDLVLCCGLGDFEALEMIGILPEIPSESKNENQNQ